MLLHVLIFILADTNTYKCTLMNAVFFLCHRYEYNPLPGIPALNSLIEDFKWKFVYFLFCLFSYFQPAQPRLSHVY